MTNDLNTLVAFSFRFNLNSPVDLCSFFKIIYLFGPPQADWLLEFICYLKFVIWNFSFAISIAKPHLHHRLLLIYRMS